MEEFINKHFKIIGVALYLLFVAFSVVLIVYLVVSQDNDDSVVNNNEAQTADNSETTSPPPPLENRSVVFATVDEYVAWCGGGFEEIITTGEVTSQDLIQSILGGSSTSWTVDNVTYGQVAGVFKALYSAYVSVAPPSELQDYHDISEEFILLINDIVEAQDPNLVIDEAEFLDLLLSGDNTAELITFGLRINEWEENAPQALRDKLVVADCLFAD